MTTIKIKNICKSYISQKNQTAVLKDVSLEITKGELFFLLGPSGCGKTTLLRIIAGLISPDSGKIFSDDKDITSLEPEKRNTAMVFQNYALWPHLSVFKNVEFGLKNKGVEKNLRKAKVLEKLELVKMQDYIQRKPNQLSGGQQQRVALARALAAEPNCLLFDEPLSNLDAQLRVQMRTEIRQLVKKSFATGIYVTHDQKEALSMADRIAIMKDGVIEQIGTPNEIYYKPNSCWIAEFVGEANFIQARVLDLSPDILLDCGGLKLRASQQGSFKVGDIVNCCIRPEWLEFAHNSDGENRIKCKCIQNSFYGDTSQCILEISDNKYLKMTVVSDKIAYTELKQEYVLNIPPEKICLLKK